MCQWHEHCTGSAKLWRQMNIVVAGGMEAWQCTFYAEQMRWGNKYGNVTAWMDWPKMAAVHTMERQWAMQ